MNQTSLLRLSSTSSLLSRWEVHRNGTKKCFLLDKQKILQGRKNVCVGPNEAHKALSMALNLPFLVPAGRRPSWPWALPEQTGISTQAPGILAGMTSDELLRHCQPPVYGSGRGDEGPQLHPPLPSLVADFLSLFLSPSRSRSPCEPENLRQGSGRPLGLIPGPAQRKPFTSSLLAGAALGKKLWASLAIRLFRCQSWRAKPRVPSPSSKASTWRLGCSHW